jgi:hypothetical protein
VNSFAQDNWERYRTTRGGPASCRDTSWGTRCSSAPAAALGCCRGTRRSRTSAGGSSGPSNNLPDYLTM